MVIEPGSVAVVIPTRGDTDLSQIVTVYDADFDVFVYDNSVRENLSVYARYAGIAHTDRPVILTQDDDCILPVESIAALLAAYEPGHVVCNMPERFRAHYPDSALVGFGAVFDRDLPARAFMEYESWPPGPRRRFAVPSGHSAHWRAAEHNLVRDKAFLRTCDVVFTTLTPRILVDVPMEILPYAHDDNRMWKQPGHAGERQRMLTLARQVRDAVPA